MVTHVLHIIIYTNVADFLAIVLQSADVRRTPTDSARTPTDSDGLRTDSAFFFRTPRTCADFSTPQ